LLTRKIRELQSNVKRKIIKILPADYFKGINFVTLAGRVLLFKKLLFVSQDSSGNN